MEKELEEQIIMAAYNIYIGGADTIEMTLDSLRKAGIEIDTKHNIFLIDSFIEDGKIYLIEDEEYKRFTLKCMGILK